MFIPYNIHPYSKITGCKKWAKRYKNKEERTRVAHHDRLYFIKGNYE